MLKKWISGLALLSAMGCNAAWNQEGFPQQLMLEDVTVLPGRHCESSAMRNAMNYQGYQVEESTIPGAGGAMGFIYQGGDFPFLGSRSLTMKEVFFQSTGIPWAVGDNSSEELAWAGVVEQLQRGNPVVLRVDMRYLPYLYGGKRGPKYMSFGWHIICLFGIDFDSETAYVSDTDKPGLQTIGLRDLHRARFSNTPFLTPHGEYYWIEPAPANHSMNWQQMLDRSVEQWLKNYEWESESASGELGGLAGMEQFPRELENLDETLKAFLLPMVLQSFHGWIEEYGTGGAAFRQFTLDYLKRCYVETGDQRIPEALELLNQSIEDWHSFSADCRDNGQALSETKDPEIRGNLLLQTAESARNLYNSEEALYQYLKEHWRT